MEHRSPSLLAAVAAGSLLAPAALADEPLAISYVSDSTSDVVWRLQDLDFDGDYNEAGEITVFYDDTVGTIPLTNNTAIERRPDGVLLVADSTEDIVLALQDLNGDGDAHDAGEHWIFFDGRPGGNLSNVEMTSAGDLFLAPSGRLWVASANTSTVGVDAVMWIQDMNNDGDANDAGEALEYYLPAPGGASGDSIPYSVRLGPDGAIYYLDSGSTGVITKGIYRLEDLDSSGVIDQPGEVTPFFIPAAQANSPFFWDFYVDEDGYFYMADTSNELIWRVRDDNSNGSIDVGTEDVLWWQTAGTSLIWELTIGRDGWIYAAETQTPDRVLRLRDNDNSGTVDPVTETFEIYNDLDSPVNIANPRSIVLDPAILGGFAQVSCPGDGSITPCPCANDAASPDRGCLHSGSVGMYLEASGTPRVSADDLIVTAIDCPVNNAGIFIATRTPLAVPAMLYDGLQCVAGDARRFQGRFQSTGVVSDTGFVAQDPSGFFFNAGTTYTFQYWTRDVSAPSPCGTNANLSSALEILYVP